VEWEAFEQRSSQLVVDMRNPASRSQTVEEYPSSSPLPMNDTENLDRRRKRGHSLSSLDVVSTRSLHVSNTRSNANLKQASTDAHGGRDKSGARLAFMDYLIKPVQRICKYPILLDQLKIGKSARSGSPQEDGGTSPGSSYNGESPSVADGDPDTAVGSALQAMKQVTSSVNEARRRQDIVTKSSLIATRILNAFSAQSSSSARSLLGHNLTHNFLSELGACLLAGSMDVIHHHADKIPGSSGTVKAKYLGAFLYMGGYLVLVKAGKGKVYEPKHWFSLVGFEIDDVPEEEGVYPQSTGMILFLNVFSQHYYHARSVCLARDIISKWQRRVNEKRMCGYPRSTNHSRFAGIGRTSLHRVSIRILGTTSSSRCTRMGRPTVFRPYPHCRPFSNPYRPLKEVRPHQHSANLTRRLRHQKHCARKYRVGRIPFRYQLVVARLPRP
jgi:hypothetical protein